MARDTIASDGLPTVRVYRRAHGRTVTFDYGDAYYVADRVDVGRGPRWYWRSEATRTFAGVNAGDSAYTLRDVEAQTAARRAYVLAVRARSARTGHAY